MITVDKDDVLDAAGSQDSPVSLAKLLALLCGEPITFETLSEEARSTIALLLSTLQQTKLTYAQFNELLLLFNQDRVQRPFFDFFFLADSNDRAIDLQGLRTGVKRFRAFAMLCFGNFRFAFRRLSQERDSSRFAKLLEPWNVDHVTQESDLKARMPPLVRLTGTTDQVDAEATWVLGYLSSQLLSADRDALDLLLKEDESKKTAQEVTELKTLWKELQKLNGDLERERAKGRRNTIKYLTWDHLDVYVATSMRQRWEFENTFRFVADVFEKQLADLPRIRWFDPTQSYSDSVIDKGLVEALMLKRAKCTIYMVQESDTFGKDSELAATLAQGKPVVAYVPRIDGALLQDLAAELATRPLAYFKHRLLALSAEEFFDRRDNRETVAQRVRQLGIEIIADDLKARVQELLQRFAEFDRERRFYVISDEQARFREQNASAISAGGKLLAAIESVAADGRAKTIKSRHPLGMQVHLETGVANGVLVARSAPECASLIRGILTRKLVFDIESVIDDSTQRRLGTALVDKPTRSKFRFVTADECITNSFWNFYLERTEGI